MTCSCGRPSRSRKSAECSACYRRRRYHEDPGFRRKAIAGAAVATSRRREREAEELQQLRRYRDTVERTLAFWSTDDATGDAVHFAAELRLDLELDKET